MMRPALISLCLLPGAALAFPCGFDTECYENEPCAGTTFAIEVDVEGKTISTDYGDLVIVAVKETGRLMTMFATGAGAEYMLSLTPAAARLSTHNNNGPEVISYLGRCEGAFG
ncbi:hypothetical protein [Marimonas lutisalis]|uniref:hypothetical protein n=1 Tax=Marimonas lutisalis TaxID=2545756 RepID=UPI0010F578FA|nr:hypothetical protein [Marimonas lutisalis]